MPLISGVLGSILGWNSNRDTNDTNYKIHKEDNVLNVNEAQKVRDFEERMSNTAYQRAFADAEAAGINPTAALLGQGGASTPTAQSAGAGQPVGMKAYDFSSLSHMSDGLAQLASSAASVKAIKQLGTAKNVADVSKILTSAKQAKTIASLAKFLV